jgi:hypothetical protein
MSLDSMRGTICGRATTAAPSAVDGKRTEAHRSCTDLRPSFYGILVVITDMGAIGATEREVRHAECPTVGRLKTGTT